MGTEKKIFVSGIKNRLDLLPAKRGWSTNPNTYKTQTIYEITGKLANDKTSLEVILVWLSVNHPNLLPGVYHGDFSVTTKVGLEYKDKTWFIFSYSTYFGD